MRRKELTPREKEVYELLQQGWTTKEIAIKLQITQQRVQVVARNAKYRLMDQAQDLDNSVDS
ncbi:bacterial regulatory s, luxR family protein [Lyngbya aestuarii BL J]|uniref:Bacterial regulatory s, luxR family protein n=1 Tax=Lyngbya aestuarii BL J TaxID=1348334 RepID=U7QRV8_9CYAN|nr:LuxR C-terminal-related transcriptional regulator [Lyngbya aestuarii]ERT09146.1 bacterial regulatory s, luxR family protein [Lyngbya aestuarii BL J]